MWSFRRRGKNEWQAMLDRQTAIYESLMTAIDTEPPGERAWRYVEARDMIEGVEFARTGLYLEDHPDDILDPDFLMRQTARNYERLRALDGSRRGLAQIQGVRKVIRKWNEHAVYAEGLRQYDMLQKMGQEEGAKAAGADFWRWLHRKDRKAFDGPARMDEEAARAFGRPEAA